MTAALRSAILKRMKWGRITVAAALLALGAPAGAQEGVYRLDMRETASSLLIHKDGRFEWYFSQGSLDLVAGGSWRREGDVLVLTSDPGITPPRFLLAKQARVGGEGLVVRVLTAAGDAVEGVDVTAGAETGYTSGGEFRAALTRGRVDQIELAISAAGVPAQTFALAAASGDELTFTFEPNDLGVEDFQGVRAAITPAGLALGWRGVSLAYELETAPGDR